MVNIDSPTIEDSRKDQHQVAIKKMNDILDKIDKHIYEISYDDPIKIDLLKIRNMICNSNIINDSEALMQMVITLHECALVDQYCCSLCADLCATYHLQELKAIDLTKDKVAFRRELLNTCQASFDKLFSSNRYNISDDEQLGNMHFIIELYSRRLISVQVMLAILCCLLWGPEAEKNYQPLPLGIQMAAILLERAGKNIKKEKVGQQIYQRWIELLLQKPINKDL